MRHNLSLDGFSLRLRPVDDSDAEFIVDLRACRGKFLHRGAQTADQQLQWMAEYYTRIDDYCFVAEHIYDKRREGLIAIYEIDWKNRSAKWGRWIMKEDSTAAVECVWLMYSIAFELLELETVYAMTITQNKKVVSFHTSCGARTVEMRKDYFQIDGVLYDAAIQEISRIEWKNRATYLKRLAERQACCR